MYFYIYDSLVEENKEYAHLVARMETQINNLGLGGERAKVTSLKTIEQLVLEAAQKKCEPIVIVGRDRSFSEAASCLARHGKNITLAFVPLRKKSAIGNLLGVTRDNAITILSRRTIKKVMLARANGHYFLSRVSCRAEHSRQTTVGALFKKLFQKKVVSFFVPRILIDDDCVIQSKINSLDVFPGFSINKLEIKLSRTTERRSWISRKNRDHREQSIFWPRRALINCQKPLPVWIDGRQISRTPLKVSLTTKQINLIVGPQRRFS